jgi:hypothetical protein
MLAEEAARAALRERVIAEMGPFLGAQIANALGAKHLLVRQKRGGKGHRFTPRSSRVVDGVGGRARLVARGPNRSGEGSSNLDP